MASSSKKKKLTRHVVNQTIIGGFQGAQLKLRQTLKELKDHNSFLYIAGYKVYCLVKKIQTTQEAKISDDKLTEILAATIKVVAGKQERAEGEQEYRDELDTYHQLSNEIRHFSTAKLLVGAMLSLIGLAIVAASGIVAAVSFGLLAPMSVFGVMLGASTIAGGIAVGTGVIGASALMGGGLLLFNAIKSNPLEGAMQDLEIAAREQYHFRK